MMQRYRAAERYTLRLAPSLWEQRYGRLGARLLCFAAEAFFYARVSILLAASFCAFKYAATGHF